MEGVKPDMTKTTGSECSGCELRRIETCRPRIGHVLYYMSKKSCPCLYTHIARFLEYTMSIIYTVHTHIIIMPTWINENDKL